MDHDPFLSSCIPNPNGQCKKLWNEDDLSHTRRDSIDNYSEVLIYLKAPRNSTGFLETTQSNDTPSVRRHRRRIGHIFCHRSRHYLWMLPTSFLKAPVAQITGRLKLIEAIRSQHCCTCNGRKTESSLFGCTWVNSISASRGFNNKETTILHIHQRS